MVGAPLLPGCSGREATATLLPHKGNTQVCRTLAAWRACFYSFERLGGGLSRFLKALPPPPPDTFQERAVFCFTMQALGL